MSYDFVDVAREGALTIVTINRPASHNALHSAAQNELAAYLRMISRRTIPNGSRSSRAPARKPSARAMT